MDTSTASSSTEALVDDVAAQASTTLQKLRDQTDAVVQRIRPQIDAVSSYARDEPTKALLIAAATGAALMGLVALMTRSGGRIPAARDSAKSALATIRDAALDLADRAHVAASDAIGSAQKYAESSQKRATSATTDASDRVSETVADAWQSLREQAAPVVDKLRPQIDAVTSYAKEDPARAILGVAAAGAALLGLLALIRSSDSD